MNGGASSVALGIYSNMAENFTAYWADEMDIDAAINNVTEFMEEEFAK